MPIISVCLFFFFNPVGTACLRDIRNLQLVPLLSELAERVLSFFRGFVEAMALVILNRNIPPPKKVHLHLMFLFI